MILLYKLSSYHVIPRTLKFEGDPLWTLIIQIFVVYPREWNADRHSSSFISKKYIHSFWKKIHEVYRKVKSRDVGSMHIVQELPTNKRHFHSSTQFTQGYEMHIIIIRALSVKNTKLAFHRMWDNQYVEKWVGYVLLHVL